MDLLYAYLCHFLYFLFVLRFYVGDFTNALVVMVSNNLKTLDSSVFKTMLQQMASSIGYLDVANSKGKQAILKLKNKNLPRNLLIQFSNIDPIDCSTQNICNLAWLIRDNPNLLDSVWSAKCSNGTFLYNLNPKDLRGPNGKTCPKSQTAEV